ncbi:helix-turn-helix domain-containing protein [Priestia megaterium]|uniref:helix-turn-helix domain-containing protein n=1 Tax=Priestia megaterium TaxID=1404 RepID=UPI0012B990B1
MTHFHLHKLPIIINIHVIFPKTKISLTQLSHNVPITIPNLSILRNRNPKALTFSTLHPISKPLQSHPPHILQYKHQQHP